MENLFLICQPPGPVFGLATREPLGGINVRRVTGAGGGGAADQNEGIGMNPAAIAAARETTKVIPTSLRLVIRPRNLSWRLTASPQWRNGSATDL